MGVPCYLCGMFVRRKVNKSGSTSVQVVDKSGGGYRVVCSLGAASEEWEIQRLEARGRQYVKEHSHPKLPLFGQGIDERLEELVSGLGNSQVQVIGPEVIYGKLYDEIGYGAVGSKMFRHLVVCRLFNPGSKLKTIDYLARYLGESYSPDQIYRFLDNLCHRKGKASDEPDIKSLVERISFEKTRRECGGRVEVVFYDMTTLYFEASDEDDLRKCGFSKDGRHSNPQIFLGLLVAAGGNPIGYDIYEGNIFEGHTLMEFIGRMSAKFGFGKPIVVADAGLLSKRNIAGLKEEGYEFIVGARPRNDSEAVKKAILDLGLKNGDVRVISRPDGTRMVVSKTESRTAKDKKTRQRGLDRLEKRLGSGRLTKANINNKGYNKYLKMEGDVKISIDYAKFGADEAWDGIKGYVTNTSLSNEEVIARYSDLWRIERAFRMNKTDLQVRPIFHRLRNRIEGHICICFTAYTIMLELERLLKASESAITLARAQQITRSMYQLTYVLPQSGYTKTTLLRMDEEQQELYDIVTYRQKS